MSKTCTCCNNDCHNANLVNYINFNKERQKTDMLKEHIGLLRNALTKVLELVNTNDPRYLHASNVLEITKPE